MEEAEKRGKKEIFIGKIWMSRLLSGHGIAVFRDSEENLCVGRRLETMRSMKWPGGKIERMVLESRSTSEQFACRSPIPSSPPFCLRNPWTIPRSLREKFPRSFYFFLDPSILYRKLSEFSERGGLVYIRIIEYSANKTRAEWIERFEYSSINFTVTGFTSHTARQSIIPPRDYKSFLELSRFFPATFVQRRRRRKKIKSIRKNVESSILVVYL